MEWPYTEGHFLRADESPQKYQICNGVLRAELCMVYVMMCTGLPTVLKCRHIAAVALSILLQVLFLSLTAYRLELPFVPTGTSIIHMQVLQCLILYEYENFSRRMYLNQTLALHSHKITLNAENDSVLNELRTTELRHLFGKLSPSSSTHAPAGTGNYIKYKSGGMGLIYRDIYYKSQLHCIIYLSNYNNTFRYRYLVNYYILFFYHKNSVF
jgi:hypothetical protein